MEKDKLIIKNEIQNGKTIIGVEFGSTRIKTVLINESHQPIASGSHEWENRLKGDIWTYNLEDVWSGLQDSYKKMTEDVKEKYGVSLKKAAAIGFSAMMHGYLVFDKDNNQLAEFRTWRNTTTGPASDALTELLKYHIPQRWSIAHLYQAILNNEKHVSDIRYITTLSGYVHWKLTGKKVLGIDDASGMFPIDPKTKTFNKKMLSKFNELIAPKDFPWKIENILPQVLTAGENAGTLTSEGAKLIDPSGNLEAGIMLCPPEGDAATGMAATNSVDVRTGNVSAGTSVFVMVVLEKNLSKVYPELDLVTTPSGDPVAMVHCNNCTSDLNAWINIFKEFSDLMGMKLDISQIFSSLYKNAMKGDADCGGLLAYNYFSGEQITGFKEGRPLFVRKPDSNFNLANFMRANLYTSLGALKIGMDIMTKKENVKVDNIFGAGGFFKTKGVGQTIMAAALETPVSVMETAGEGGAWGIALLASYMINKKQNETLGEFLSKQVFKGEKGNMVKPDPKDVEGFNKFMDIYKDGLKIEQAAVDSMK